MELSPKLRPKGVKTLVTSPLRWAEDRRDAEDAEAAVVSCLMVLGQSTPKRKKDRREKKKKKDKGKKFAGSSTDLEWSLRGNGERGME